MAFGRKRKDSAPQQQQQSAPQSAQPGSPYQSYSGSGGYTVTELPYYDKGKRKVVVYTSDANGKIIKRFKK